MTQRHKALITAIGAGLIAALLGMLCVAVAMDFHERVIAGVAVLLNLGIAFLHIAEYEKLRQIARKRSERPPLAPDELRLRRRRWADRAARKDRARAAAGKRHDPTPEEQGDVAPVGPDGDSSLGN